MKKHQLMGILMGIGLAIAFCLGLGFTGGRKNDVAEQISTETKSAEEKATGE